MGETEAIIEGSFLVEGSVFVSAGGPVAKWSIVKARGPGFDPGSGN